jgi:hypothetical protein
MPAIMTDHDVEGQVQALLRLLTTAEWFDIWQELAVRLESFAHLGIPVDSFDMELWRLCQAEQILLITAIGTVPGQSPWKPSLHETIRPPAYPC